MLLHFWICGCHPWAHSNLLCSVLISLDDRRRASVQIVKKVAVAFAPWIAAANQLLSIMLRRPRDNLIHTVKTCEGCGKNQLDKEACPDHRVAVTANESIWETLMQSDIHDISVLTYLETEIAGSLQKEMSNQQAYSLNLSEVQAGPSWSNGPSGQSLHMGLPHLPPSWHICPCWAHTTPWSSTHQP